MRNKILLLGSGELGKEVVIAMQRLGQYVIAVDNYENAPAMQVAHESEVINMLDGAELDRIVAKHIPDFIVPEVESIRTERFYEYEKQGYTVIPTAKAANVTMNRKAIRDLAAIDLGVKTAKYKYASSYEQLKEGVEFTGMPCVVKPLMSSSGKGQSVIKIEADIQKAWNYALEGSRGDLMEVIVEAFIDFDYEITLLTLTQNNGNTLFCPPIGHRQERGDYQESWQPMAMEEVHLNGSENQHVPGIVNISFAFVEGESLMMALRDLAVSSGSACTSASLEPSYVLRALGLNDEMAHSSIRFSIGRYTTEADIDAAIAQVRIAVEKLRLLSPLWDMFKAGIDLNTVQWSAH